jgi:phosphoribosylanthranilate isomerase
VSTTRIKFCGVTRELDAEYAVSLGAWAVGMIMWPKSPRAVSIEQAAAVAAVLRRQAEIVGVFVNPTLDEVVRAADFAGLTMLQFHGQEGPNFCAEAGRRTGCKVIKAARVQAGSDVQALSAFHTDFHLLDSYVAGVPGGSGETFAWDLAAEHRLTAPGLRQGERIPLILSGGLTPENVGEAVTVVRPYAVDVASGVELSPGIKIPERMRAFAEAVAATDAALAPPSDEPSVSAESDEPSVSAASDDSDPSAGTADATESEPSATAPPEAA